MAKERKEITNEYKIPKNRPINEIFLSLNGSSEDYAFRGVKDSWKEFCQDSWKEFCQDGKNFYEKIKKGG